MPIFLLLFFAPPISCWIIFCNSLIKLYSAKAIMKNDSEKNLSEDIQNQKVRMAVSGIIGAVFTVIDVAVIIYITHSIMNGSISLM